MISRVGSFIFQEWYLKDFGAGANGGDKWTARLQGPEQPVPRLPLGRLLSWKRPSVFQEIQTVCNR